MTAFHHRIVHDSFSVNNYIARSIKALQKGASVKEVIGLLEKAAMANNRVNAVAQFATKANFRSRVDKEPTDLPAFIEQYINHVAKDFIGSNLRVNVVNNINEPFELKTSRIELSILLDNIISNADKADAKQLNVSLSKEGDNTLVASFIDNGKGLSEKLDSPEAMFEMGVTTTPGSGLGLFHARGIVEKLGGKIMAIPREHGMELRVEITK